MTADNLILSTIIILAIGYSQLVVSHTSELEILFSSVSKLGITSCNPAKSCREIYDYNIVSRGHSGYYWINNTDNILKVYCAMELTCGGITGGWMRIANIDTTQGDDCPSGWSKITQPRPLCRDQVMLLYVILLTSLITRLNIILSVENYKDIKKEVQMLFTQALPLMQHTLMVLL